MTIDAATQEVHVGRSS